MNEAIAEYKQYICRACGLIYDEAEGDPDSGLAPGTRFEDIPDDWECPLCGVTKTDFELFEKRQPAAAPVAQTCVQETGVVVLGAGLAGWAAVEAIREQDAQVPITLVTACSGDRYHKPELSVALSRGLSVKKLVRETALEAAARLNVHLLNHTFASGLSPVSHQLRTTRGSLHYTRLVIAQGARARLPEGLNADHCWRINDLRCWSALAQQLQTGKQKVLIIGAGMIGCELAEDIAAAGHSVTLSNRNAYPLREILPDKAGERLLTSLIGQGIRHRARSEITTITRDSAGKPMVHFSDGHSETFDHVIAATGLQTENRLAEQAGLAFDGGVVVNPQTLRTSAEHIYALGDCISIGGRPCRFIEPIVHQARVIAQGVLDLPAEQYQHQAPVVRLKTRSLPVVLHGLPSPDLSWATTSETPNELVMEQCVDGQVRAQLRLQRPSKNQAA